MGENFDQVLDQEQKQRYQFHMILGLQFAAVSFVVLRCETRYKCWIWKGGSDAGGRITADQAERSWICVVLLHQTGPALLDNPQGLSVQIWQNYPTPDQPQITEKIDREGDSGRHEISGLR